MFLPDSGLLLTSEVSLLLQVSGFLAAPARTSPLLSPQPLCWVEETCRHCPPAASVSRNRVEPPPSSSPTEMGKRLDLEFSSPSSSPFVMFIKAFLFLGTSKKNNKKKKRKRKTTIHMRSLMKVLVTQSCLTLCDPTDCPWDSPGKNTGVDG